MTGGSERRDESVTFSLRELTKLEDERIAKEQQAREASAQAAEAAREATERRERAALEAREREASEERARARHLEVEEEARREAMSRAAVEQARIEVEARTRAEESDRERRHELELQRMRLEARPARGLGALVSSGLGGAAVAIAGCLVVVFAVTKPASDRRIQELDRAVATAEGRASALERRVEEQSATLAETQRALDAARDLAAPPPAPAPRPAAATPVKTGFVAPPPPKPPAEKPCANRFDPLCFHIP
jgi:colicin import membrane protein